LISERLKIIAGQAPLPTDMLTRAELIEFADAHHVLGQMAVAWHGRVKGKLVEVFENAILRTEFDHRMLEFELNRLERALGGSDITPVVLKGGAYVATNIKASYGRRVSDLDILVPVVQLAETEKLLRHYGWENDAATDNAYDQNYYRKYMHELSPLRHVKRKSILDVHHALVPKTSRVRIQTEKMIESAVLIEDRKLKTFEAVDVFIHAAVHAFADGSFDTPTRSLLELNYLLQDLDVEQQGRLGFRARTLGAEMPIATALWMLSTTMADLHAKEILESEKLKPANCLVRWALIRKLEHAEGLAMAKFMLFIRSHYLRMPYTLLAAHLLRKIFRKGLALKAKGFRTES